MWSVWLIMQKSVLTTKNGWVPFWKPPLFLFTICSGILPGSYASGGGAFLKVPRIYPFYLLDNEDFYQPIFTAPFLNFLTTENSTKVTLANAFRSLACSLSEDVTPFQWVTCSLCPSSSPTAKLFLPSARLVLARDPRWAPWPCNRFPTPSTLHTFL